MVKKYIPATLVAVVRDEEDNILYLLEAIKRQTFIPKEIIIVDGGSIDRTVDIIEDFKRKNKDLNIKVIKLNRNESTIPKARNIGIREAKYDIIIGGDAGIEIPGDDWIENLYKTLDENTDFVAGTYDVKGRDSYQEAINDVYKYFLSSYIDSGDEKNFHPSNRSLLFRKKIWESLGGYKEDISRGEDTWFSIEAKRKGFKMKIAKNAKVYWFGRKSLKQSFKLDSEEARSDIRLGNDKNLSRYKKYYFELYLLFFSILLSLFFKSFIPVLLWFVLNEILLALLSFKIALWSKKFYRIFYYFLTVNTIFYAYLYGILKGKFDLFKRKWKKNVK